MLTGIAKPINAEASNFHNTEEGTASLEDLIGCVTTIK